jgi:MFS family permease
MPTQSIASAEAIFKRLLQWRDEPRIEPLRPSGNGAARRLPRLDALRLITVRLPPPYGRLLLPVYLPSLLMALSQMALLILLPLYMLDLGHGTAFAALIVGLRGVGVLLFDVPAGMLVARFGDRPVLLGGLALILVGNLTLALSDNPWILGLAAVILGTGFSAWMLGRQSYIADTCASHEIGRAIAFMAGLQRAGAFIGPAAGGALASFVGYPATFAIGAVNAVVAGVLVVCFTRTVRHRVAESIGGIGGAVALLRGHAQILATAGLAAFALQLMRSTRQLLMPLFGQAVGLNVAEIGLVYSFSAGVDMSLFFPVGHVADRYGRKWTATPCMVLFAAGLAVLPWVSGFYSLLGVGLLLGLANGLGSGIVMIIGADIAQRSGHRGQFLGLWRLIGDLGMSSAPMLTGALVNVASLAAASLSAATVGLAGAIVMVLLVPETLRKRADDSRARADSGGGRRW